MLLEIYNTILIQPLLNLLIFFYNILWQDMGLAIIVVTILVRLVLYPSFKHQLESQKKLSELQPKLQEVKEKYKNDREQQSRALMELYRKEKVNPFGSCLPMIVQLIILIALYQVFKDGLNGDVLQRLYPFVSSPGEIHTVSFGFLDLSERSVLLAVITGAFQFVQSRMMMKFHPRPTSKQGGTAGDITNLLSKQFVYVFPLITVVVGMSFPAGLVLYWLVTTLFAIGQQYLIMRGKQKPAVN